MAFNGSGTYVPPAASFPAVASTLIESAKYNAVINDIATALTTAITKDGQTTITANLPMATFRHTGVGNAAALTDYASADQVVDNALTYGGASAAGTDTYAVSLPISPGAYAAGQQYQFKADVANTGACTVNFNAIGAGSIKMPDGSDPFDGAIPAGSIPIVEHDGTNFILQNPYYTDDPTTVKTAGDEDIAGEKTFTNLTTIFASAAPEIRFSETDAAADNKNWEIRPQGETFICRTRNDALSAAENWLEVDRTGTTVDTVNFPNGTLQSGGNQVWDAGNQKIIFKTADESVTSSTTLQDDDHITGFTLTAGKWYRLRGNLHVTAASSSSIQLQIVFTNAIQDAVHSWKFTGSSTVEEYKSTSTIVYQTLPLVSQSGIDVEIMFKANATTGGTCKLQWAQGTSGGTATIIYAGSYLELTQMD